MLSRLSDLALTPIRAFGRWFISPPNVNADNSRSSSEEKDTLNHELVHSYHTKPAHSTPRNRSIAGLKLTELSQAKIPDAEHGESYISKLDDVSKPVSPVTPVAIHRWGLRSRAGRVAKTQSSRDTTRCKARSKRRGNRTKVTKSGHPKATKSRKVSKKGGQAAPRDKTTLESSNTTPTVVHDKSKSPTSSVLRSQSQEKHCYDDCKILNSTSHMTRCCSCMRWFHDGCIAEEIQSAVIWNCNICRFAPFVAREALQKVSELTALVNSQYELFQCFETSLATIVESNALLTEACQRERARADAAMITIENLQNKLSQAGPQASGTARADSATSTDRADIGESGTLQPCHQQDVPVDNLEGGLEGRQETSTMDQPRDRQEAIDAERPTGHQETQGRQAPSAEVRPTGQQEAQGRQETLAVPREQQSSSHCEKDTLNSQRTAVVFGSSIIKRLDARRLSRDCGVNVFIHDRLYLVQDVTERVRSTDARTAVIHCGGNNLKKESAAKVIDRFKNMEVVLKNNKSIENVVFSAITIRKANINFNNKMRLVNVALQLICEANGWTYIDNSSIGRLCLSLDGIHLNEKGCSILHTHIANNIRDLYANFHEAPNNKKM